MKVAMLGAGFIGWGGGIDFLKAYIQPLKKIDDVKLYVFLPRENKIRKWIRKRKNDLKTFLTGENIQENYCSPLTIDAIAKDFASKGVEVVFYEIITKRRFALIDALRTHNIDVVFPAIVDLGEDFPIPWVLYLPDFQHKYYPDFFTEEECKARDVSFGEQLKSASAVIVEAEDVEKDIFKFYPDTTANVFVMPYTAVPEPDWLDLSDISLEKYNLPKNYFLISNQFWIHKDHITAFEALSKLIKSGFKEYDIVCTGLAKDYRDKDYLAKIRAKLCEFGIEDRVHFLGYIPKRDQMKIMCSSVAVIQPTLFEGNPGGGIAYNAVSLGVPIILSDIPVNQELKAEWVRFFQAGNPEDLKNKMKAMIKEKESYIVKAPSELVALGEKRLDILSDAVHEVLKYAALQ